MVPLRSPQTQTNPNRENKLPSAGYQTPDSKSIKEKLSEIQKENSNLIDDLKLDIDILDSKASGAVDIGNEADWACRRILTGQKTKRST